MLYDEWYEFWNGHSDQLFFALHLSIVAFNTPPPPFLFTETLYENTISFVCYEKCNKCQTMQWLTGVKLKKSKMIAVCLVTEKNTCKK